MRRFAGYALKVYDAASLASAAATASFLTLAAFSVGSAREMILNMAVKTHASTPMEEEFDSNAVFRSAAMAIALTGLAPLVVRGVFSAGYNLAQGAHATFCAKPAVDSADVAAPLMPSGERAAPTA